MALTLYPPAVSYLQGDIHLPGSKSESNRALILQAMSGGLVRIEGLSEAQDTQTLQRLLTENPETMDVGHAGTTMRFLAAFLAFRPEDKILTGSARMQERPIGPLVDALRKLGAEIAYLGREGYPPLMIFGRNAKFRDSEVVLPGNVSSQFVSALLLIGYRQPDGLRIRLQGEVLSRPYIQMTLELLQNFGIGATWEGDTITVPRQHLRAGTYSVEADWSAASYWFCMAALTEGCEIRLHGLRPNSLQGDSVVADKMADLGVLAYWQKDVLVLTKRGTVAQNIHWDFADCPDLAQGMIVAAAALGVEAHFTGLQSLRIKETDRIAALQQELAKFGMQLLEGEGKWWLSGQFMPQAPTIATYDDHRMAMAFAPLALRCPGLTILEPEVVNKSYPGFWKDLEAVGFWLINREATKP
jgi:3-phosphoshikimate 1-carboxyvinyltransferase